MKAALDEIRKCEDEGLIMPRAMFTKLVTLEKVNPGISGLIRRTLVESMMKIGDVGPQESFRFAMYRGVALGYLMALDDIDVRKKAKRIVAELLKEMTKSKKEEGPNAQPGNKGK